MGYIKHDAVLVVAYQDDTVKAIEALRDEMPQEYAKFLVGPVEGVNCYKMFALLPDGSKEGWDFSSDMDEWREKLLGLFRWDRVTDYVHVRFGGDDCLLQIKEAQPHD